MENQRMYETVETVINDGMSNWETCIGFNMTKDFVFGMIDMYLHLNWDRSDSSLIISFINAIDTIEWHLINNHYPEGSLEEHQAHAHNVQLLGSIRRELERFMNDCLQELNNF